MVDTMNVLLAPTARLLAFGLEMHKQIHLADQASLECHHHVGRGETMPNVPLDAELVELIFREGVGRLSEIKYGRRCEVRVYSNVDTNLKISNQHD